MAAFISGVLAAVIAWFINRRMKLLERSGYCCYRPNIRGSFKNLYCSSFRGFYFLCSFYFWLNGSYLGYEG